MGVGAGLKPRDHWSPDETFYGLLRDRDAVNGMLAEVAGKKLADKSLTTKLRDGSRTARLGSRLDALPGYRCLTCTARARAETRGRGGPFRGHIYDRPCNPDPTPQRHRRSRLDGDLCN